MLGVPKPAGHMGVTNAEPTPPNERERRGAPDAPTHKDSGHDDRQGGPAGAANRVGAGQPHIAGAPSRFIHEIAAHATIDASKSFSATFEARIIDELLVVFDARHSGPPVCVLGNDAGESKEVHMQPAFGREGHFSVKLGGPGRWSKISVHLARGKAAKLLQVKLIGVPPG